MMQPQYKTQVNLLLNILPFVAQEESLALKGGTAINMFVWDMPRLSVDIDLTYLPFDDRDTALANISDSLMRLRDKIRKGIPGIQVETALAENEQEVKLVCKLGSDQVKVEVNRVMRGNIKPTILMPLCAAAQKEFNKFAEIKLVSSAELFGGKICAAMDRQHPRDLFDVHQLFTAGGLTEEIKEGFIASLLSHPKSINEVLRPTIHNQQKAFDNQFQGMTNRPFSYDDFEVARERLIKEIHSMLTDKDKALLMSIKSGNPDWSLSNTEQLQNLPAIIWKLKNINKYREQNPQKHAAALLKLEKALNN